MCIDIDRPRVYRYRSGCISYARSRYLFGHPPKLRMHLLERVEYLHLLIRFIFIS